MGEEKKTGKAAGCVATLLLVAVSLLGAGAYLMQGWNESSALPRTAAVVLIVLGSLLMVPLIIAIIAFAVIRIMTNKLRTALDEMKDTIAKPAQDLVEMNKAMYGQIHEFRPATDADFDDVDRSYYEQMTAQLRERGFIHLGDLVDRTIEEKQHVHPPIRIFTAEGGTTQAAVYHLNQPKATGIFAGKVMTMREAVTELSDGGFLLTSNTKGLDMTTPPPKLLREQVDLEIPLAALLDRHEERKADLLKQAPGLTCVAIKTLEEAIESERRQQLVKNAFRKEIGFVDPEEVKRVADAGGRHEVGEAFAASAKFAAEREKEQNQ